MYIHVHAWIALLELDNLADSCVGGRMEPEMEDLSTLSSIPAFHRSTTW